uniref:Uncharacterized protein n=1 Tax=Panagrellus redivivus TaxID=6233 RepID=A0A7E4UXR7_PANRE
MAFVMDDIDEAPAGSDSGNERSDWEEDTFVLEEEMDRANDPKRKFVDDFEVVEPDSENESLDKKEDSTTPTPASPNAPVASSLPIAINFGVDPKTNKPRPAPARREKRTTSPVPHGSIYESMMEISRSMQPEDNRLFGTKPSLEEDRNARPVNRIILNPSQIHRHGMRHQPTCIVYKPMPIPSGGIGEEASEEASSSQTPK